MNPPKNIDIFLLSCLVALITAQPFFLHHEVIMMETGIHLPALNALFHGAVPYRDFFYLRGPVELYVPAIMMLLFGKNMAMLPIFYYAGTILTLLVCVLLAKQIYRTRWMFYLAILVLAARTFPRIAYYYWGGLRYALGFLAIFLAVLYFRKQKMPWILLAGIFSAIGFLTTAETGVCSIFAVASAFLFSYIFRIQERSELWKAVKMYVLGLLGILLPVGLYFYWLGALGPFFESMYAVIVDLNRVFPGEPGVYPDSMGKFFLALLPNSRYFKFMTPVYFYLIFACYIGWRLKKKRFAQDALSLICIAAYGLILYAAAFRKIEGHHFEMALQPEKLLLFFVAEEAFFFLWAKKKEWGSRIRTYGINFLFCALVLSSVGYFIARCHHRFPMFQLAVNAISGKNKDLSPLAKEERVTLRMDRANGLVVPKWQAEEFIGVTDFLTKNTAVDEVVFAFPEVGNFNFLADRPFVGKFPIVTFSWMKESWEEETIRQFQEMRPRYVVMTKVGHRTFPDVWYFRYPKNKERFTYVTNFILSNYEPVAAFNSVVIYQIK